MTQPHWKPAEELSPFARLIRDGYMWKQTPNLTVPQLAAQTGISKMTIWSWLNRNATPRRDTVMQLAKTTGLPLDDLLHAAGLPTTVETLAERRRNKRALTAIMRRYETALDRLTADNPAFTPAQRAMLLDWIRNEVPALILRGGDLAELLPDLGGETPDETQDEDEPRVRISRHQ